MRFAFDVFAPYRNTRKATIFGSSRTAKGRPEYALARDFSRTIADRGWMIVTGAGPGIMEAGHEGAGGSRSFGVNIVLPFEATANPFIAGDPKLINFKYFFTRKLMFIKESDAFVLMPGGFGTLDEAFELLTLIQTGKCDLHPIVMLDVPGGTYWKSFDRYLREELLGYGYIAESDLDLFMYTDDINAGGEGDREVLQGLPLPAVRQQPPDPPVERGSNRGAARGSCPRSSATSWRGRLWRWVPRRGRSGTTTWWICPRIALNFDRIHAGRLRTAGRPAK